MLTALIQTLLQHRHRPLHAFTAGPSARGPEPPTPTLHGQRAMEVRCGGALAGPLATQLMAKARAGRQWEGTCGSPSVTLLTGHVESAPCKPVTGLSQRGKRDARLRCGLILSARSPGKGAAQ